MKTTSDRFIEICLDSLYSDATLEPKGLIAIKFSSVQVQFSSSSVQFSSVQFSSVQFKFSSVQFSSVQFKFGSVQFSSVQFSSVQFFQQKYSTEVPNKRNFKIDFPLLETIN